MTTRFFLAGLIGLLGGVGWAYGQNPDGREVNPPAGQMPVAQQQEPAYPDQPVVPQDPSLRRRAAEEQPARVQAPGGQGAGQPNAGPPQPPFVLTPAQEIELDRVLLFWEKSSQGVKTFRAKFRRFEYNPGADFRTQDPNQPRDPNQPTFVDDGEIRYQAPDKGSYSVDPAPPPKVSRPDRWICDGKSIYQYDFVNKVVREYKLPPELQGKAIANGPVPFLFGAKAEQLKRRYWMRIVTPPDVKNQIWLEAKPKFAADAQNFEKVELILEIGQDDVVPTAVKIYQPGGKASTVYKLWNIAVNQKDIRSIFEAPFDPRIPPGWQKVVEDDGRSPNGAAPIRNATRPVGRNGR